MATDESQNDDLIIEEGFPVLNNFRYELSQRAKLQNDDKTPNEMPKIQDSIPRYPFASFAKALSVPSTSQRSSFLKDCSIVFTARTREDAESYSTGSTFFLPCLMKPRCALEGLAQTIFRAHVDGLEWSPDNGGSGDAKEKNVDGDSAKKQLLYDPERSGVEWWTLVLDTPSEEDKAKLNAKEAAAKDDDEEDDDEEDDEVGMHFDADYGLEEQLPHYMLHPRVATVTYLSDTGVPTLILDKRSPPPPDEEKKSLNGAVTKAWLSHPSFGKHVAFDGRFLHGAPGEYFPAVSHHKVLAEGDDAKEPASKKMKTDESSGVCPSNLAGKRITFLANIWLNHCPIDAEILDDEVVEKLTTEWEQEEIQEIFPGKGNLKEGDPFVPPFKWEVSNVAKPDKLEKSISLSPASGESDGPAGVEDLILCNRHVDMTFGASKDNFHVISKSAAEKGSVEIDMDPGVITLEVGDEVSSDEESDGDGDED